MKEKIKNMLCGKKEEEKTDEDTARM